MNRPIALATLLALSAACVTTPEPAPTAPPPPAPSFTSFEEAQVKTTMGKMAWAVIQIEDVLLSGRDLTAGDREAVVKHLNALKEASWQLDEQTLGTIHGNIGRNLPRLRVSIANAIDAAVATPANMYPAAAIAGQCHACHASRL